jgi:diguanylate cyclase (GGDEF)-like protein
MDYTTSHIFFLVSLGLFTVALFSLALVDRSVVGTLWLAASTLIDFTKTLLQELNGHLPRFVTVCVANELNILAFLAMYLGLRWFVVRKPFGGWVWLLPVAAVMAIYPIMFFEQMRRWSFSVASSSVLGVCAVTVWMLLRQKNERFTIASRLTAFFLTLHMVALTYRCVLSIQGRSAVSVNSPWQDARWMYSMLAIMLIAYCILLLYVLFSVLEMHGNVAQAAGMDALTGALNRRALMKHAEQELAQSERLGRSLSIVGLDLDNFKKVNDMHGHGGGDVTLCAFVDLVKEQLRTGDVIARMGGEEFVLMLPGMDASCAARMTENLRHSLAQMRVHYDGRMIVMTASAGVTEMQAGDSLAAMLKRADASLYRAKAEGRNCVVLGDQVVQHPKPVLVERFVASRQQSGKRA